MCTALVLVLALTAVGAGRAPRATANPAAGLAVSHLQVEDADHALGVSDPQPRLSWSLDALRRGETQTAYWVEVAPSSDFSSSTWRWSYAGSDTRIRYEGPQLASSTQYYWRVRVRDSVGTWTDWSSDYFVTGPQSESDWHGAAWVAPATEFPQQSGVDLTTGKPIFDWINPGAVNFRFGFSVDATKTVDYATATVVTLGPAVAYLNGDRLNDHELDAAFTDYSHRVLSVTSEIPRDRLGQTNVLGLAVGNGWYNTPQHDSWNSDHAVWEGPHQLRALVVVHYTDGSVGYSASASGSVQIAPSETLYNAPYAGETVQLDNPASTAPKWYSTDFDASQWRAAVETVRGPGTAAGYTGFTGSITPQLMPAMTKVAQGGVTATQLATNVWLYRTPVTTTGWAALDVSVREPTTVSLDYDERLGGNGLVAKLPGQTSKVDDGQTRGRWQHDEFRLPAAGTYRLEPRFTYKGFQYIQVKAWTDSAQDDVLAPNMAINQLTVYQVSTRNPRTGSFTSSDGLLTRLHEADVRTLENNWQGLQTDCPTREKMGWLADVQASLENGLANFDGVAFYEKILGDARDAYDPTSGRLSAIAPQPGGRVFDPNDPWWMGAPITIAWGLYRYHHDVAALADNWTMLSKLMDYMSATWIDASNGTFKPGAFGDWIAPRAPAGSFMSATALYLYARTLSDIATALGRTASAAGYAQQADTYRAAINDTYYDAATRTYRTSTDSGITQTELAMELALGIVPTDAIPTVRAQLTDVIAHDGNQFTTGIIGTKYLLRALDDAGLDDLAYRMVTRVRDSTDTADPTGYATMLSGGYGSIWEGWRLDDTISPSANHPALTSVEGWLYSSVAGIHVGDDGSLTIAPHPVGGMTSASGTVAVTNGSVSSSWTVPVPGGLSLDVEIPPGSSARVVLGNPTNGSVTLDGAPAAVTTEEFDTGAGTVHRSVIANVGSGRHKVTVQVPTTTTLTTPYGSFLPSDGRSTLPYATVRTSSGAIVHTGSVQFSYQVDGGEVHPLGTADLAGPLSIAAGRVAGEQFTPPTGAPSVLTLRAVYSGAEGAAASEATLTLVVDRKRWTPLCRRGASEQAMTGCEDRYPTRTGYASIVGSDWVISVDLTRGYDPLVNDGRLTFWMNGTWVGATHVTVDSGSGGTPTSRALIRIPLDTVRTLNPTCGPWTLRAEFADSADFGPQTATWFAPDMEGCPS